MARVTHVKKAQQRYEMVPVLDEQGNPKRTPVMKKVKNWQTGEVTEVQKKDKRGNLVFMKVTVADKTRPKPNLRCDFPGCDIDGREILPGTPYKHITPKSGPYGGTQKNRHEQHPSWNIWEYSSSLSARVAQVQSEADQVIEALYEVDDFESVRDDLQQMAQDLLDEKQESLDNMPEGLAEGSMLQEQVEALESWVDEIGNADAPDEPDPEPVTKWVVKGPNESEFEEGGYDSEDEAEQALDAYIDEHPDEDLDDYEVVEDEVEGEEPSEDQIDDWLDEAKQVLRDALESFEG